MARKSNRKASLLREFPFLSEIEEFCGGCRFRVERGTDALLREVGHEELNINGYGAPGSCTTFYAVSGQDVVKLQTGGVEHDSPSLIDGYIGPDRVWSAEANGIQLSKLGLKPRFIVRSYEDGCQRRRVTVYKMDKFDYNSYYNKVVGQAKCGCVWHAEQGIPCEHDLALAQAKGQ